MRRRADRIDMLLWAYPRTYRQRRGEEILDTLREGAPSRSTFENLRVAYDVVAYGLRRRFGTASDQPGGKVLAAAALPGMIMAAAAGTTMAFFGLLWPDISYYPADFGPSTVTWPILYLVWLLGALGALVFPRHKRICAAACVLLTVLTMVFVPKGFDQPWLPAISLLIGLAVPALLAPRTSPRRSHRGLALLIGGVCLGVLVPTAALNSWALHGGLMSYLGFRTCAPYVAAALLLCGAILLVAHRWMDATALAVLAVPWLVFGTLDQQTHGAAPTFYAVWAEVACAVMVGLVGSQMSRLIRTSEPAHSPPLPSHRDRNQLP